MIPKALVGQSALLPFLALIAATGFWGSSFITVARTLESTDPFTLVFLRFGVGALLVALWLRGRIFRIPLETWKMGAVCAVVIYASYLFNHIGLMTILSSTSGFLTALYVPITPFLFLGDCRSAAGIVRLRGGCSSFQRVSAPCGSFQFRVFIELGRMDDNFLRLLSALKLS